MGWIWIASKIFNDRPITNRVFAYLTNVEVRSFNKLEIELLTKLDFNALMDTEMYKNYEEQLQEFWNTKNDLLNECFQEYKRDKKLLKVIKKEFMQTGSSRDQDKYNDVSPCSNYSDPHMRDTINQKTGKNESFRYIDSSDKFRFESYNSHNFKNKYKKRKLIKSKSLPLLLE